MDKLELLSIAKPIPFNTELVQAIFEGRKTVTRRVIKFPEGLIGSHVVGEAGNQHNQLGVMYAGGIKRPRYQINDILYVKETWMEFPVNNYHYRADFGTGRDDEFFQVESCPKWKPSRFMPKRAARIFLRVQNVRAEKIQEITVDDISKEGIHIDDIELPLVCRNYPSPPEGFDNWTPEMQDDWFYKTARASYIAWCDYADQITKRFGTVWDTTINPKEITQYGWNANPWVWVYEFERIDLK